MLKKINNYIYSSIFISIIFLILGIICIINPSTSFDIISTIIMLGFIINGIVLIIIDYKINSIFVINFLYGILSLILGLVLLFHPDTLKVILPFGVGIWFMISGLTNIKFSMYIKEESIGYMILTVIMSIISILCGFILILKPVESIEVLTITLGITLLINSISSIIDMCIIKKYINKIVKGIKHYIKEVEGD